MTIWQLIKETYDGVENEAYAAVKLDSPSFPYYGARSLDLSSITSVYSIAMCQENKMMVVINNAVAPKAVRKKLKWIQGEDVEQDEVAGSGSEDSDDHGVAPKKTRVPYVRKKFSVYF